MLKPSEKWTWYYDDSTDFLMLDLGEHMIFKTNLERKQLVDCAIGINQFSVDDASAFHTFKDSLALLPLSEPRQAEFALYGTAAKRFHKPIQPKSWYFDAQEEQYDPNDGDIVQLGNHDNSGLFMVLEVGENASLIAYLGTEPFQLSTSKLMHFGQAIKVMHDRMQLADLSYSYQSYAMVG